MVIMLPLCAAKEEVGLGKIIHGLTEKLELANELTLTNSLVDMYCKVGYFADAPILFEKMRAKMWSLGIPLSRVIQEEEMLEEHFILCEGCKVPVNIVLGACSTLSAVKLGKEVHCFALKTHLIEDTFVHCSIIDMYAKSGFIGMSKYVFDHIPVKDIAAWTAMITGYAVHGLGMEVIKLFLEMQKSGFTPTSLTYVSILMACNHAGLIEEGRQFGARCSVHVWFIYGDWDSVRQLRQKMKELGLQKEIGCSQIEIGGKSYNFAVGDMLSKPCTDKAEAYSLFCNLASVLIANGVCFLSSEDVLELKFSLEFQFLKTMSDMKLEFQGSVLSSVHCMLFYVKLRFVERKEKFQEWN
ncbi:pentatricopeptide repeat-containing protein At1g18485-like [Nicotiana sylvestris]|uniref:pentatricopeptide repeat-containing protein At1g18485-like n=1 Tax=Nicotiana sylvestris TaxID=4096 RepID=UPI00388CC5BB